MELTKNKHCLIRCLQDNRGQREEGNQIVTAEHWLVTIMIVKTIYVLSSDLGALSSCVTGDIPKKSMKRRQDEERAKEEILKIEQ